RSSWCEAHHVIPWWAGGATNLDNLVLLCSFHHHVVHRQGWTNIFDGTSYTITNPDNLVLTPCPQRNNGTGLSRREPLPRHRRTPTSRTGTDPP
ncbi:MAG TPA: HNH endonuclease signature motif containing protein, partial [Acidimicrobiia bacterium]